MKDDAEEDQYEEGGCSKKPWGKFVNSYPKVKETQSMAVMKAYIHFSKVQ